MAVQPPPISTSSSPPVDPAVAEAQASQLTTASLTSYGHLPNPQMVFEAINSGATPALTQAITEGQPGFSSVLSASPAGASIAAAPQPPATVTDPASNVYTMDWNGYWGSMHNLLGQDENASWRSFGSMPILNLGWMQGVTQNSSPDATKQWQHLLQGKGFLDGKYQVSGVWDQTSQAALRGFMISLAMPTALYEKDPKKRGDAKLFLGGLGVNTDALDLQIGRDPTFSAQVAQQWMAAQGPDAQTGTKHELQLFADKFGVENLPQSYQAIIHEGFLDNVRDGLLSLPLVGLLNDVPGVSGGFHALVNTITGNWDPKHLVDDPRKVREEAINSQLSADDKKMLQPALQQAQNSAGFLGFMDGYDQARTKFVLSMVYTVGDMVTGKFDSHKDNPFDPMSGNNIMAQAHQDNMAAGLFGDQWAADHDVLAGITNFAANVVDDPVSYVSLLGKLDSVQRFRGTRTVGKAIGKDEARSLFYDTLDTGMRRQVNQAHLAGAREFMQKPHATVVDKAKLFGIGGLTGDALKAKSDLVDKILDPKLSEAEAYKLFTEGDAASGTIGLGWLLHSHKNVYNLHANWESLAAVKEQGLLGKLRVTGGFMEPSVLYGRGAPYQVAEYLAGQAFIAGRNTAKDEKTGLRAFGPHSIKAELDAVVHAGLNEPNNVQAAFDAAEKAIHDHLFQNGVVQSDLDAWVQKHKAGALRPWVRGAADAGKETVYAPDPKAATLDQAKETSFGPPQIGGTAKDGPAAALATKDMARAQELTGELAHAQEMGATSEQLSLLQAELDRHQRAAPAMPDQLADELRTKYTTYELLAYTSPLLKNSETVQAQIHMDYAMNMWRRITIGALRSAFRITLGDDGIRPALQLIASGHVPMGLQYLHDLIWRSTGIAFGKVVPAGKGTSVRGKVMADTQKLVDDAAMMGHDVRPLLQNFDQLVGEHHNRVFTPYLPGTPGYHTVLSSSMVNNWHQDPQVMAFLKGGKQGLSDFLRSDDPAAKAVVEARGAHLDPQFLDHMVDQTHDYFSALFADPDVARMTLEGKVDKKLLEEKISAQNVNGHGPLPVIPGRTDAALSDHLLKHVMSRGPSLVFDLFTKPMVDSARLQGYVRMKKIFEQAIRKEYEDKPGFTSNPNWEKTVGDEAHGQAMNWVVNNTYQGGRSAMGGTVRNVFPFFGATANMDRFWMRQAAASSWTGSAALHAATASQRAQVNSANNPHSMLDGVLAHLGFGAGEGLQFNPLHSFFLTSDGIGSFTPGTGPIFAPLWSMISGNPDLAQMLSDIPGVSQQIDYNTGKGKPTFPWIADILSGISMATTGQNLEVPLLTKTNESTDRMVDEQVKAREQAGQTVTESDIADIRRTVGRDLLLQGGLSFTVPMSPQVTNSQQTQLRTTLDQWRQATTNAGKDAVVTKSLGVTQKQWSDALANGTVGELIAKNPQSLGAVMAYLDRRVGSEERDIIAQTAPWVVSAGTSEYQTTGSQHPVNLPQWQALRALGNVSLLKPEDYVNKIGSSRDINTAWLEYDKLKQNEYQTMALNGWTSTDQAYKDWKASTFDPAVIQLETIHPAWAKTFGSQSRTDAPGLAEATVPLRSVSTWEVIPQHSDYENQQSILWRNALLFRDAAAAAITEIHARRGAQAEIELVMTALHQHLMDLGASDPFFQAQLNNTRFGSWEDVVNLQAMENKVQAQAATNA